MVLKLGCAETIAKGFTRVQWSDLDRATGPHTYSRYSYSSCRPAAGPLFVTKGTKTEYYHNWAVCNHLKNWRSLYVCVCGVIAFPQSYYSAGIDVNDAASLKILRKKYEIFWNVNNNENVPCLPSGCSFTYLEMPIMTVWVWFGSLVIVPEWDRC